MCEPLWAHTGDSCDQLVLNSWAVAVVLTFVILFSVVILTSDAKKLWATSTKRCRSGLAPLATMLFRNERKGETYTRCRYAADDVI